MHPTIWLALGYAVCKLTYFDWRSALTLDASADARPLLYMTLVPVALWAVGILLPMGILVRRVVSGSSSLVGT